MWNGRALLEVQVAGQGKESEAKVKDIAKITHEVPVEKLPPESEAASWNAP